MSAREVSRDGKTRPVDGEPAAPLGAMPTPYYDEDGVRIYHGDCREILPLLPTMDLVLTDPPYGIGASSASFRGSVANGWADYGNEAWDEAPPDATTMALVLAAGRQQIVWGGNYFDLPPSQGWLVWDKGQRDFSLADGELAWTNFDKALRIYECSRARALRDGKEHPTQKPLTLMVRCIDYADRNSRRPIESIVDPFMGSGTTLRAAKDMGRTAIGIELSEAYCEIAARRLAQGVLFGGVA